MTPLAFPEVPEVYIIIARSSGAGSLLQPSQVKAESSLCMISNVSMSKTRVSLAFNSGLSFASILRDMKIALHSEWLRIFETSLSEESGRIGTAMRPNATMENIATVQLGIFWDRMAIRSPAQRPYLAKMCESSVALTLSCP